MGRDIIFAAHRNLFLHVLGKLQTSFYSCIISWAAFSQNSSWATIWATFLSSDVWAMDSGRLSLQLCEAKVAEHSKPDEIVEPCCACEEAKYEVTFEGLWSEDTHPKNFPSSQWLLHFSDIIGASHSADYRYLSQPSLLSI